VESYLCLVSTLADFPSEVASSDRQLCQGVVETMALVAAEAQPLRQWLESYSAALRRQKPRQARGPARPSTRVPLESFQWPSPPNTPQPDNTPLVLARVLQQAQALASRWTPLLGQALDQMVSQAATPAAPSSAAGPAGLQPAQCPSPASTRLDAVDDNDEEEEEEEEEEEGFSAASRRVRPRLSRA
jgi:hypothetical protein